MSVLTTDSHKIKLIQNLICHTFSFSTADNGEQPFEQVWQEGREYTEEDIRKEGNQSKFVYSFENIDYEDTVVKVVVVILIGGVVFFSLRGEK